MLRKPTLTQTRGWRQEEHVSRVIRSLWMSSSEKRRHQNPTSAHFLKVRCNVGSGTLLMNMKDCTTFKPVTCQSCIRTGILLITILVTSCISSGKQWFTELRGSPKCYISVYDVKSSCLLISPECIQNIFKYWEAVKLTTADTSFPKV